MIRADSNATAGADLRAGQAELRAALRGQRGLFGMVLLFSVFVNLLMLTGPLYMLQVYDRVLASGSEPTLVALSILVTALFLALGLLDHARACLLNRIGTRLQDRLDRRVFAAALARQMAQPEDGPALAAQQDVEAVQRLWASPLMAALVDLPWTPIFLAAIFLFHPLLGWLALAGGVAILGITLANQALTRSPLNRATAEALQGPPSPAGTAPAPPALMPGCWPQTGAMPLPPCRAAFGCFCNRPFWGLARGWRLAAAFRPGP